MDSTTMDSNAIAEGNQQENVDSLSTKDSTKRTRRQQSQKFEKRVTAFLNAKYSNRPQVEECKDYVLPDLPGGAHLVVKGREGKREGDIYLGPKTAASPKTFVSMNEAVESMQKFNIAGIVNCTTHVPCYFRGGLEDDDNNNIKYCVIPEYDEDGANLLQYFTNATTFMQSILCQEDAQGGSGNILVHCEVGVSRSSSVVMAYLIRFHGLSREDAYLTVKKRRPKVNPNQGFWKQLKLFETQCNAEPGDKIAPADQVNEEERVVESGYDEKRRMIQESYILYTTCRDIMGRRITDSNCSRWLLPPPPNRSGSTHVQHCYYKDWLSLCIDAIWTHGILAIDVEWLVFCCQQLCHDDREVCDMDSSSIQVMIEDTLTNPDSEFVSSREGRISPRHVQKILVALDDAFR